MNARRFVRLNEGWNADPNVPEPLVEAVEDQVRLRFFLNWYAFEAGEGEEGILTFLDARAWRLGDTNDEGWYLGQCRYSAIAPAWGEYYEIVGDDPLRDQPSDWQAPPNPGNGDRHFLFYLRDDMFECFAGDWRFERRPPRAG